MPDTASHHEQLEHLFRHESGKMLSVLTRLFGFSNTETAEDIVQDTLLTAFETWKLKGVPEQPRAWLYRVAKNKAVDYLRREHRFQTRIAPQLSPEATLADLDPLFLDHQIEDAQLRMMFACCHPSIRVEAQLPLILRSLCGLSTQEIAAAFLLPPDTLQKRLFRAKEQLKQIPDLLEPPEGQAITERLDAILQAVYLLFNEGYKSASASEVIRIDICLEALRLVDLLTKHPSTRFPKTYALQSLLLFHVSRFDARLDAEGQIVLLEHQDRQRWDRTLIAAAYTALRHSSQGAAITEYHIEAAIASYHASAPDFESTNWKGIYYCYELLWSIQPSPMVALNRAIALGYADSPKAGIEALQKLTELSQHYLWWAALGEMHRQCGEADLAQNALKRAIELAPLDSEKAVLLKKWSQMLTKPTTA